jgi:hypothetical protein
MPKPSLPFILCVLFSLTVAAITAARPIRADDLSQGLQLYRAGKPRQAIPLLEKAAQEGHEEAIQALDRIYASEPPAVNMTDEKTLSHETTAAKTGKTARNGNLAETAPVYEKATVAEDPKETADRDFMRKLLLAGIAVVVILACAIQYTLLRRMRNRQYCRALGSTDPKQRKSGK